MKTGRMIAKDYDSHELLAELIKQSQHHVLNHKLQLNESKSDFETGFLKGVIASHEGRIKTYTEYLNRLK